MQVGLKILVVDDNPTILKLICKTLEKAGELVTATDGADALMKAIEITPDLIISDYSMPVMDGRALFDKLRARPETRNIPSVFLASQREIDERLRSMVEGAEDFFVKPFFVREFARNSRRITARLLQQKMEKLGAGGGTIKGSLSELSVIDWMQSLEQGRKSCTLILRLGKQECRLHFTEGQVTHATCGSLTGDKAAFRALAWIEGEWELDFSKTSTERSTSRSTQALMMEGLRLLDEANRENPKWEKNT